MENNIERLAAETILERGVRVTLPAPRFLRLVGKKQIRVTIAQPTLGTLHTISCMALKEGFSFEAIDTGDLDAAHQLIAKHAPTVARIMAVVILRRKHRIKWLSGILGRWLLENVKPKRMAEFAVLFVAMSGVQDFTTTIRLFRSMTVTAPKKNLSPKEKGSQEAEQ